MRKIVIAIAVTAAWLVGYAASEYSISPPDLALAAEADAAGIASLAALQPPPVPPQQPTPTPTKPPAPQRSGDYEWRQVPTNCNSGQCKLVWRWVYVGPPKPQQSVLKKQPRYPQGRFNGHAANGLPRIEVALVNGQFPPIIEINGQLWDLHSDGLYHQRVVQTTPTVYNTSSQGRRHPVLRTGWRVVSAPVRFWCRRCR